jgi:hypothetical protein
VDYGISVVDRRNVRRRGPQLADNGFDPARPKAFGLLEIAHDRRDLMIPTQQRIENGGTDVPGCAGQKNSHRLLSCREGRSL